MINITVSGNLGRDAELRQAGSDTVLSFSVASTDRKKNTTWVSCSLWGKRGEALREYLMKGTRVVVIGEASLREYVSQGEKKTALELRVDQIDLVGGGRQDKPQAEAKSTKRVAPKDDDELPF